MDNKLFGLIGFPLEHSFSVLYFSEKFSREGIQASYRNFPLKNIAEFKELIASEQGLVGLNVTVPYKEQILPYLDALSETARNIKAVNTICFCRKEGIHALVGHNTDVIGFERSLKQHLKDHHQSALVLGTGGSSKAVTYVLKELGMEYSLVSRSRGEDRLSYDDLDEKMVANHPVIINTTPLGMHPDTGSFPSIHYEAITPEHLLFDLIYNPEKTAFLLKGEERGARIVNGYDMLVYQADASWDIWNGRR